MRRNNKVGLLISVILLSSASFAFASLAIFPPPELPMRLPHPSSQHVVKSVIEPVLEQLQANTKKTGPKYFLDYNAWRHIQASA